MRLRTLPVSLAGVVTAVALAVTSGYCAPVPAILCLLFALLAQIASNFGNEYFDYKAGLDAPGRVGPRRGVTEGDITPRAMCIATFATLALACAVGLCLIPYGGWWLIVAGIFIAIGVLAYSTGPYPLSHHALGEVAVILFFGIIPVCLTYMLAAGRTLDSTVVCAAIGMGLLGANVLVVNNYRDRRDDAAVGKTTIATLWPRPAIMLIYLFGGLAGIALTIPAWLDMARWWLIVPACAAIDHIGNWIALLHARGTQFNPLLGRTSVLMAALAVALLIASFNL